VAAGALFPFGFAASGGVWRRYIIMFWRGAKPRARQRALRFMKEAIWTWIIGVNVFQTFMWLLSTFLCARKMLIIGIIITGVSEKKKKNCCCWRAASAAWHVGARSSAKSAAYQGRK